MSSGGGGGTKSTSTTTTNPDPTAQRLNTLYGNELESATGTTGGVKNYLSPNALAAPSEPELQTLGRVADYGTNAAQYGNPYQLMGMDQSLRSADPTLRLGVAQRNLQDIVTPALTNSAIAGGFGGRSGAALESIGRAGKEMALPISQDVAQKQSLLGYNLLNLAPQFDQSVLSNLYAALGAQGAPREAAFNESQRQQNLYYSQLLNTPISTGSSTIGQSTQKGAGTNWLTQVAVPLISAGLMGFGGCWVAEALYGKHDQRTTWARFYMFFGSPRWIRRLYRAYGPQIARGVERNRLIRLLARPLMDYAWRRGKEMM